MSNGVPKVDGDFQQHQGRTVVRLAVEFSLGHGTLGLGETGGGNHLHGL